MMPKELFIPYFEIDGSLIKAYEEDLIRKKFKKKPNVRMIAFSLDRDCINYCRYCFLNAKPKKKFNNNVNYKELIKRFKLTIEFLKRNNLLSENLVLYFFRDSEPLPHLELIKKIIIFALNELKKENTKVMIQITTSGKDFKLKYKEKFNNFLEFLKQNNIPLEMNLSFDFTFEINFTNKNTTYEDVISILNVLKDKDINYNIFSVYENPIINKKEVIEKIIFYLTYTFNLQKINRIRIQLLNFFGRGYTLFQELGLTYKEYYQKYVEFFINFADYFSLISQRYKKFLYDSPSKLTLSFCEPANFIIISPTQPLVFSLCNEIWDLRNIDNHNIKINKLVQSVIKKYNDYQVFGEEIIDQENKKRKFKINLYKFREITYNRTEVFKKFNDCKNCIFNEVCQLFACPITQINYKILGFCPYRDLILSKFMIEKFLTFTNYFLYYDFKLKNLFEARFSNHFSIKSLSKINENSKNYLILTQINNFKDIRKIHKLIPNKYAIFILYFNPYFEIKLLKQKNRKTIFRLLDEIIKKEGIIKAYLLPKFLNEKKEFFDEKYNKSVYELDINDLLFSIYKSEKHIKIFDNFRNIPIYKGAFESLYKINKKELSNYIKKINNINYDLRGLFYMDKKQLFKVILHTTKSVFKNNLASNNIEI